MKVSTCTNDQKYQKIAIYRRTSVMKLKHYAGVYPGFFFWVGRDHNILDLFHNEITARIPDQCFFHVIERPSEKICL